MKRSLLFFLLIYLAGSAEAQDEKAFKKGKSVVSAGFGIVNIWKSFLEDAISYPEGTYKVSSKGPFTVVYEYGFTKRISAGVALGYSEIIGKFDGFGEKFTETLTNFSILARGNYHIGKFKKFDPYLGVGIGYYIFNYHNSKPGIVNSKQPGSFGYSGQLGAHYFFTPQWAAYAEAGYVGGSLGQLGVSFRFR